MDSEIKKNNKYGIESDNGNKSERSDKLNFTTKTEKIKKELKIDTDDNENLHTDSGNGNNNGHCDENGGEKDPQLLSLKHFKSSNELSNIPKIEQVKKKLSYEDFEIIRQLGKGSYGTVFLAKYRINNEIVALKTIEKRFVEKVLFNYD